MGSTTARMTCTATVRSRNSGGGHTAARIYSLALRNGYRIAPVRALPTAVAQPGSARELEQPLGVAAVDLVLLRRREVEGLDVRDGLARVHAGLRLERHV